MNERIGNLVRQFAPLVLIGVALVAAFGRWLPGFALLAQKFGEPFLLGVCVFVLAFYVLLLWSETLRLRALMSSLLEELVQFRNRRAAELQGRPAVQKLEAVRLLIPALTSADAQVQATGRRNLALLVGQDLGAEPRPWQEWLAAQERAAAAGPAAGAGTDAGDA